MDLQRRQAFPQSREKCLPMYDVYKRTFFLTPSSLHQEMHCAENDQFWVTSCVDVIYGWEPLKGSPAQSVAESIEAERRENKDVENE